MISLLRKLFLICLVINFLSISIFASNKNAKGVYPNDCTSASSLHIMCVSMVGGVPVYTPSTVTYPSLPVVDFAEVVTGAQLTLFNVDVTGWDLTTSSYTVGFQVVNAKGKVYTLSDNFYMLESSGTPDFTKSAVYFVKNDKIKDSSSVTYLSFENYGEITQTMGDFVNLGVTIIGEDARYYYTPSSLGSYFYTEILHVGSAGGNTAILTVDTHNFSFMQINIQNGSIDISNTTNVLITGVDREIKLFGDATMALHAGVIIENDQFGSRVDFEAVEDNNTFIMDNGSYIMWKGSYAGYVEGEGPSMTFSCSSKTCTQNSIVIDNSELHINTLSLDGMQEFHITVNNGARYNIEHYELVDSVLIYDLEFGTYESSLSQLYTHVRSGTINVDANSSFTLNANDGEVHFHGTKIDSSGDVTLNFTGSTRARFSDRFTPGTDNEIIINFTDTSSGSFDALNLDGGSSYINLTGDAQVTFNDYITGVSNSILLVDLKNNSFAYFKDIDITSTVHLSQVVYVNGAQNTLLRFDDVKDFLSRLLVYSYTLDYTVRNTDFKIIGSWNTKLVLMQIKNDGAIDDFPDAEEALVIDKINASGSGLGGGGGYDSFSVLVTYSSGGGGSGDANLIDYVDISGVQYAEFGLGGATIAYNKAQDQYGEADGLLTLTTTENMNGYGIAVVFDNIVLSTTDTEPYRLTLFNLVINNSVTVEQLGNTLNSLGANMTLSNVLYSSSILELEEKRNATALLSGERFTTYVEVRNLENDNFQGNYLAFGASLMFFESERLRLGISGFYSPYTSTTIYDSEEQNSNIGASLFASVLVGRFGAIMFDASVMHSFINGISLALLSSANIREYNYATNSAKATLSFNFGSNFGQRIIAGVFARQSQSYAENSSDLALNVTTPSYNNMFVGYYSRLLSGKSYSVEFGVKYYFKENQKEGTAGFMNDPAQQQWVYQYVLLGSPWDLSLNVDYNITKSFKIEGSFNKRGEYTNFGFYFIYAKYIGMMPEESGGDSIYRKADGSFYDENNVL